MKKVNKNKPNPNKRSRGNEKHALVVVYGPLSSSLSFQPRWLSVKVRYSDTITVTMAAASYSAYMFNTNSLYDPDRSGTGHQPRGYDQLTPLYNRYRVDNMSYTIEFGPSTADYTAVVGVVNGSGTFSTVSDLAEATRTAARVVPYSGSSVKFRGRAVNWRVLGRSRIAYHTDDTTGATNGASPAEVCILHIVTQNPSAGNVAVVYTVTLDYDAVFYDYIMPGAS